MVVVERSVHFHGECNQQAVLLGGGVYLSEVQGLSADRVNHMFNLFYQLITYRTLVFMSADRQRWNALSPVSRPVLFSLTVYTESAMPPSGDTPFIRLLLWFCFQIVLIFVFGDGFIRAQNSGLWLDIFKLSRPKHWCCLNKTNNLKITLRLFDKLNCFYF